MLSVEQTQHLDVATFPTVLQCVLSNNLWKRAFSTAKCIVFMTLQH